MADENLNTPEGPSPFPHTLGDPNADNNPEALEGDPKPVTAEDFQQLKDSFEQQRQEWNEREQRYQQSLDTLMQRNFNPQQTAPVTPAAPAAPEPLNFDDLPDPVQDPKGYNRLLAERIQKREQAMLQNFQGAQQNIMGEITRAQALDALWSRFSSQHGELAKRSALLQGAAAVTFNELRSRGVDPVAMASQSPDTLIGAIAQRMQAELGTDGGGTPATPAAPGAPGAGAARTAGIAGGSASPANGGKPPPAVKTLEQQLLKQQQDMGLI